MSSDEPQIAAGMSCWNAVGVLVAAFDNSGIDDPTTNENDAFQAWVKIEKRVREGLLRLPSREALSNAEVEIVRAAIDAGPTGWHAAAWALDVARHHTFSAPWVAEREVVPADGDLFPVCDWDIERRPLRRRLSRPWQTQRLVGDLPHVRRFRTPALGPSVVFDGRFFDELAFLSGVETISFLTANASLDDFDVPAEGFPIRVRNEAAQTASILSFIEAEIRDGNADVALVPELAGAKEGAADAAAVVGAGDRNAIILAGSRHVADGEHRANVASLVLPSGETVAFEKRAPFWDIDVREDITPPDEPIRILVSAGVRLAVLICKDFLVRPQLDVVAQAGANLILVPSMSRRLELHDVAARELAVRSHALSIVANGPLGFEGEAPATSLIGRPESEPSLVVATHRTSEAGHVARFSLARGTYEEVSL